MRDTRGHLEQGGINDGIYERHAEGSKQPVQARLRRFRRLDAGAARTREQGLESLQARHEGKRIQIQQGEVRMNLDPRVFPTILMILDFIAAIPYAVQGDIRHAVYWVAAGVLTLTVTW